jgi:hypothetical protein
MRINSQDQPDLAATVKTVLLDGKPVPMCYAADDEEGWVISYIPSLPQSRSADGEDLGESAFADMTKVRREGAVEILFHESTNLDN